MSFEINLKVEVQTDTKGFPVKTTVTNVVGIVGSKEHKLIEEFDSVLEAYAFLGDYFYDMIEDLTRSDAKILKSRMN